MRTVKPRKLSKSQKPLKQSGMGFVEVLVASAILALTVAGSVTLLGGWTQALSETRNRTDALVRLISVMDLGKHEIALIDPNDPNYSASLVTGVVSPTQRISGFTVGDITTVAGVNRTKFEASITWLNPYESGADANSKFELHSYHPERRGFVAVSSLTTPVCVGAGCSNVDDDCIISASGPDKGKGKSQKSDGTNCNTTSKTKSSKSYSLKSKSKSSTSKSSCNDLTLSFEEPTQDNDIVGNEVSIRVSGGNSSPYQLSVSGDACTLDLVNATVSYTAAGTCNITASQSGICTSIIKRVTVETEYCEVSEYPYTSKSGKTTTKYEFYEENSAACACYEVNSTTGSLKSSASKAKSKYSQTCPYTKGKKDKTKTGT